MPRSEEMDTHPPVAGLPADFVIDPPLLKDDVRQYIHEIEDQMVQMPQVEIPVQHYFSKGLYAREVTLPAGALVIGKIHKFRSLTILSKGEVSILSTDGMVRVKAPHTFVASPGVKRMVYAHEESVWTTIHASEETDPAKIEEDVIAHSYSEVLEANPEVRCLG